MELSHVLGHGVVTLSTVYDVSVPYPIEYRRIYKSHDKTVRNRAAQFCTLVC